MITITSTVQPQKIQVTSAVGNRTTMIVAGLEVMQEVMVGQTPNVNVNFGVTQEVQNQLAALISLRPIILLQDVVAGELETVTLPVDNPNRIGMVQQVDGTDGDRVYYPNFTTTPDGRSAIFYSIVTQNQNKIIVWPRPLEA